MTIHDDVRNGSLNKKSLDTYLRDNPKALSELDPKDGYPPLAAAAVSGKADVVRLLIKRGAKGDTRSRDGETPLLLCARKTSYDRARITQLLLPTTPQTLIDASGRDGKTALIIAVKNEDAECVRLLRKAGASPEVKDARGDNARSLAKKGTAVQRALDPEGEKSFGRKLADTIMSFALLILAWFNAASGAIKKLFKLTPKVESNLNFANVNGANLNPTSDEFVANIGNFVKANPTLARFFKGKEDYLQEVARKVAELTKEQTASGAHGEKDKSLSVALHQQVIYCDDSGSMKKQGRWEAQKTLIDRIARITTRLLPDNEGVGLYFINQDLPISMNLTPPMLADILASIPAPTGNTPIGTALSKKILDPLVYQKLPAKGLGRPLLVTVITDGMPSDEPKTCLKDAILECGAKLQAAGYPRESVKFMIGQIGQAESATKFLNDLRNSAEIADVAYITADKLDEELSKLRENEGELDRWLIETLFSPIKGRETKKER